MKYYLERLYPYLAGVVIVVIMMKLKLNFINNSNINNALDGVNTIAALIIGFLGAILPVILGMKNESKIVKYVFEKDDNRLFLKYVKATILLGLMLVSITILLYFRDDYSICMKESLFYIWVFLLVSFLGSTYRSLTNMLDLVFMKDADLEDNFGFNNSSRKSSEEESLENKYSI